MTQSDPPDAVRHPYLDRPASAFWRLAGATQTDLYRPRWAVTRTDRIATAGSCFAQRLGRALRERGLALFDVEPPPAALPPEQHAAFGYGLYTARYGNLYTTRQLLQLAEQAFGERDPRPIVWTRGARFFDAQRPTVEPEGLDSPAEVAAHRAWHLDRVRALFAQMEVFVFTLGMTEAWADRATGTVFPTAPGVVAGRYDPAESALLQLGFQDVCDELEAFRALLARHRTGPRCRILLTVSPVPVAATATDDHVLVAAVGSKATLRAAATELRARHADIDYLPSFDLVASPCNGGLYYNANRRTITPEGVARAVALFFDAHGLAAEGAAGLPTAPVERLDDAPEVCEDAMLDAFAPDR